MNLHWSVAGGARRNHDVHDAHHLRRTIECFWPFLVRSCGLALQCACRNQVPRPARGGLIPIKDSGMIRPSGPAALKLRRLAGQVPESGDAAGKT
jgi:hypothetical protein